MASKFAVIKLVEDDSLKIISVYNLEHYNRDWLTNCELWPVKAKWMKDEKDDDCKILHMGEENACEAFVIDYEKSKSVQTTNSQHQSDFNPLQELKLLQSQVKLLMKDVQTLKMENAQLREGQTPSIGDAKTYTIGLNNKIRVSLHALNIATAVGLKDATGFCNHLARRVFLPNYYENKTWKDFDDVMQTNILELLAFFIFSVLARENPETAPKPSELHSTFNDLLPKVKTWFTNRKSEYINKQSTKENEPSSPDTNGISVPAPRRNSKKRAINETADYFKNIPCSFQEVPSVFSNSQGLMNEPNMASKRNALGNNDSSNRQNHSTPTHLKSTQVQVSGASVARASTSKLQFTTTQGIKKPQALFGALNSSGESVSAIHELSDSETDEDPAVDDDLGQFINSA